MMRTEKNLYRIKFIFLTILITGLAIPHIYANDTCVDCHKDEKFRVQNKALFDYYNDWKDSIHDLSGVTCTDCHGGDSTKTNKNVAHKKNFSSLSHIEKESYKKIPSTCGECHDTVLNNFKQSKHYEALFEKAMGPHCATCHGSMNAEVYYTSVIARTCQACHNEYTKNRPEVVGEADKILHRINVTRAFRNWISIHYAEKEPEKAREINALYKDIADSWHSFDFVKLDEKSMDLLNKSKSLVNRGLAEKRKKK